MVDGQKTAHLGGFCFDLSWSVVLCYGESMEKEFKKAVRSEGFSFEHSIFKILEENRWTIIPNRYFLDSYSEKTKEYDLLAFKFFQHKGYEFFLVLIIECKYNPHRIVFYTRQLKEIGDYPFQFFIGGDIKKVLSFPTFKSVITNLKQYKKFFYSNEQIFGYQTFEKVKEKNRPTKFKSRPDFNSQKVFESINTVMQAIKQEQKIRIPDKNLKTLILFFPLVVFSGKLFKASFGKRKTFISKNNIFKYRTSMISKDINSPEDFCVYVFDKSSTQKAVRIFNFLFNKFSKIIMDSVDKIEAQVPF